MAGNFDTGKTNIEPLGVKERSVYRRLSGD
jgi:hypothetical protein